MSEKLIKCPNPWCRRGPILPTEAEAAAAWNSRPVNPLVEELAEALEAMIGVALIGTSEDDLAVAQIYNSARAALEKARTK